ncbi:hypothetical protein DFS33DRAFT_1271272 [Desarmillaria ectypa]|nr:hypothetical protein DFS33DRAFT_1271272 [Desarmillaria ectypa]
MSTPRRSLLFLVFALIQCSCVNAYYVTCTGFNCDSSGPNLGLILGLAFGLFALLLALSLIFACWRHNRIRNVQRTYVQNAQAQAFAAQQAQQNYQAEFNVQYSNYPQLFGATAQGWQPVPAPEPVHQHHQVHPQHQIHP